MLQRKVIHIAAEESPNVAFALAEIAGGKKPSHTVVVPGLLTYEEYRKRRETWDIVRQTISLDGKFYQGAVKSEG
jgi:hypothetical protein